MLSEAQILRYSRQIILPAVGGKGQQRLLSGAVAVVGAGEMAAAAALYLSAAGVGALTLAGTDRLPEDLDGLNPDCRVTTTELPATLAAAAELARGHGVVVTANAEDETSRRLNAACVACGSTLVWGEAHGHTGRFAVLASQPDAPCYNCLRIGLERNDGSSSSALKGAVAAFIGAAQAAEAIKLMLHVDRAGAGKLFTYDAFAAAMHQTTLAKHPDCEVCGRDARNAEPG